MFMTMSTRLPAMTSRCTTNRNLCWMKVENCWLNRIWRNCPIYLWAISKRSWWLATRYPDSNTTCHEVRQFRNSIEWHTLVPPIGLKRIESIKWNGCHFQPNGYRRTHSIGYRHSSSIRFWAVIRFFLFFSRHKHTNTHPCAYVSFVLQININSVICTQLTKITLTCWNCTMRYGASLPQIKWDQPFICIQFIYTIRRYCPIKLKRWQNEFSSKQSYQIYR